MKRFLVPVFSTVLVLTLSLAIDASAQNSEKSPAVLSHVNAAKAVAYEPGNDLTTLFDTVCAPALDPKGPKEPNIPAKNDTRPPTGERANWRTEPGKVFDNLYYVGSPFQSTWAVTTSAGIIIIDSGYDYSAKELITDGLKKLGEDPAQIKYLILTHAHSDRYWGAKYVQDTYKAHLIVSEADWHGIEISPDPTELKPKKDMVATDGMKLTLGDTTLTIYVTPGHMPGTISVLVPLKDGNQRHLGAVWGGINPNLYGHGVRNGPTLAAVIKTWSASTARFMDVANKAGADTYLTIHPGYDMALEKIRALPYRKPGDAHPFVSQDNLMRFLTIIKECGDAQLARIESGS